MRQLREQLIKYPGNVLGDNEGYPVRWTYLLGEIFHPLVFRLRNDLLIDDSIRPTFSSYKQQNLRFLTHKDDILSKLKRESPIVKMALPKIDNNGFTKNCDGDHSEKNRY